MHASKENRNIPKMSDFSDDDQAQVGPLLNSPVKDFFYEKLETNCEECSSNFVV